MATKINRRYKMSKKVLKPLLEKFTNESNLTKRAICAKLDVHPTTLGGWIHTGRSIPFKYKAIFEKKLKVNLPLEYFTKKESKILPIFVDLFAERGSQSRLAEYLDVTPGYVNSIITGKFNVPQRMVKQICKFFKGKLKPEDLAPKKPKP